MEAKVKQRQRNVTWSKQLTMWNLIDSLTPWDYESAEYANKHDKHNRDKSSSHHCSEESCKEPEQGHWREVHTREQQKLAKEPEKCSRGYNVIQYPNSMAWRHKTEPVRIKDTTGIISQEHYAQPPKNMEGFSTLNWLSFFLLMRLYVCVAKISNMLAFSTLDLIMTACKF